jgi:hypothetical protein
MIARKFFIAISAPNIFQNNDGGRCHQGLGVLSTLSPAI